MPTFEIERLEKNILIAQRPIVFIYPENPFLNKKEFWGDLPFLLRDYGFQTEVHDIYSMSLLNSQYESAHFICEQLGLKQLQSLQSNKRFKELHTLHQSNLNLKYHSPFSNLKTLLLQIWSGIWQPNLNSLLCKVSKSKKADIYNSYLRFFHNIAESEFINGGAIKSKN